MSTITIKASPATNQLLLTSKYLISQMQVLESQLRILQELLNAASHMIVKHQYDKLMFIQYEHLSTHHSLLTCMQLIRLGLYDAVEVNSPFSQHKLQASVKSLDLRLKDLKRSLFIKTRAKRLL